MKTKLETSKIKFKIQNPQVVDFQAFRETLYEVINQFVSDTEKEFQTQIDFEIL